MSSDGQERWRSVHEAACREGALAYTDPQSGYRVFTAIALRRRGQCCGSGCRHCPFGHVRVASNARAQLKSEPWLEGELSRTQPYTVVFWSGGKDAFLALQRAMKTRGPNVVLVTTFDGQTNALAHQDLHIDVIRAQANALGLPLLLVPLYSGVAYSSALQAACTVVQRQVPIQCVVFGDLHLTHVRQWREDTFKFLECIEDLPVYFPLWRETYSTLMEELEASGVRCFISAVADDRLKSFVKVGMPFDRALMHRFPDGVDHFGECGAFHTVVASDSL